MIPISTDTPVRRTPWANYAIIAVNLIVYLVLGGVEKAQIGTQSYRIIEALTLRGEDMRLHQFFSYQFLHAGVWHIGGNMLFLWIFGNAVNGKMGNISYALFYLAGGVFAAVGDVYLNPDFYGMVGASGAIAAVTTAYLALFPRSRVTVLYWWFIIGTFELPSMILIVFKMILWDNVFAQQMAGESNVAFDAHLAGYAFGFTATAIMLAVRVLPRDQFDIVALGRRWYQRQSMRKTMSDPNAEARARLGRVARPVSVRDVWQSDSPVLDRIADLRKEINDALGSGDRAGAATLYSQLMELDPRQVLSRSSQSEVAYQLYIDKRFPQAAAAYEKLLAHYPGQPDAAEIELLLGIIYARELSQYEVAKGHLRLALEKASDEKRREQALHWLDVIGDAPGPEPAGG